MVVFSVARVRRPFGVGYALRGAPPTVRDRPSVCNSCKADGCLLSMRQASRRWRVSSRSLPAPASIGVMNRFAHQVEYASTLAALQAANDDAAVAHSRTARHPLLVWPRHIPSTPRRC